MLKLNFAGREPDFFERALVEHDIGAQRPGSLRDTLTMLEIDPGDVTALHETVRQIPSRTEAGLRAGDSTTQLHMGPLTATFHGETALEMLRQIPELRQVPVAVSRGPHQRARRFHYDPDHDALVPAAR